HFAYPPPQSTKTVDAATRPGRFTRESSAVSLHRNTHCSVSKSLLFSRLKARLPAPPATAEFIYAILRSAETVEAPAHSLRRLSAHCAETPLEAPLDRFPSLFEDSYTWRL